MVHETDSVDDDRSKRKEDGDIRQDQPRGFGGNSVVLRDELREPTDVQRPYDGDARPLPTGHEHQHGHRYEQQGGADRKVNIIHLLPSYRWASCRSLLPHRVRCSSGPSEKSYHLHGALSRALRTTAYPPPTWRRATFQWCGCGRAALSSLPSTLAPLAPLAP